MNGFVRGALATVVVGGAVAVSACGPSDSDAAGTSTPPATSGTSASATSAPATESSAPSESPEGTAHDCAAGDLTAEVIQTAGQRPEDELFRLRFTANGKPCRLSGFPEGLTFVDEKGARMPVKVTRLGDDGPQTPVLVTKKHSVESIVVNGGARHDVRPARVDFDLNGKSAAESGFSLDWPGPIGPEVTISPINNLAG